MINDDYVVNLYALEEYPDYTIRNGTPISERVKFLGNQNTRVSQHNNQLIQKMGAFRK